MFKGQSFARITWKAMKQFSGSRLTKVGLSTKGHMETFQGMQPSSTLIVVTDLGLCAFVKLLGL